MMHKTHGKKNVVVYTEPIHNPFIDESTSIVWKNKNKTLRYPHIFLFFFLYLCLSNFLNMIITILNKKYTLRFMFKMGLDSISSYNILCLSVKESLLKADR